MCQRAGWMAEEQSRAVVLFVEPTARGNAFEMFLMGDLARGVSSDEAGIWGAACEGYKRAGLYEGPSPSGQLLRGLGNLEMEGNLSIENGSQDKSFTKR